MQLNAEQMSLNAKQIAEVLGLIEKENRANIDQKSDIFRVISMEAICRWLGYNDTLRILEGYKEKTPINSGVSALVPYDERKIDLRSSSLKKEVDASFARDYRRLMGSGIVVPKYIAAIYGPYKTFDPPEKITLF